VGRVLRILPEHVSVYMLEVDEDSRLGKEVLAGGSRYGAADIPDDDAMADFYDYAGERFAAAGYELAHTWARSAIAEALGNLGQVDVALVLLAEAHNLMERNDERYLEAEIHRINGELKLKQARALSIPARIGQAESEAEQSFLKAIEIASRRNAKALELRAATSLSCMLMGSGRRGEALGVLQPIHDWFTEGLDWPELKTAKALLNDLESSSFPASKLPTSPLPAR